MTGLANLLDPESNLKSATCISQAEHEKSERHGGITASPRKATSSTKVQVCCATVLT